MVINFSQWQISCIQMRKWSSSIKNTMHNIKKSLQSKEFYQVPHIKRLHQTWQFIYEHQRGTMSTFSKYTTTKKKETITWRINYNSHNNDNLKRRRKNFIQSFCLWFLDWDYKLLWMTMTIVCEKWFQNWLNRKAIWMHSTSWTQSKKKRVE